jgi:hypothetical protein
MPTKPRHWSLSMNSVYWFVLFLFQCVIWRHSHLLRLRGFGNTRKRSTRSKWINVGLELIGENCCCGEEHSPVLRRPQSIPNGHAWHRTRSSVMRGLRHATVHTFSRPSPRDKLRYLFSCSVDRASRYNRVKKNQLDAQLILSIFRQPLHVSGVSRSIIRRYKIKGKAFP